MAGTKKERLAQAARKIATFSHEVDYEEFELKVARGGTEARLPLAVTIEQGAEFKAAVEADDLMAFLDVLDSWGYGATAATLKGWPTIAAGAAVRRWLETIDEAQGAVLGES